MLGIIRMENTGKFPGNCLQKGNKNTRYFQITVDAINATKQGNLTESHWIRARASLVRVLREDLSGLVICELSPESGEGDSCTAVPECSKQGKSKVIP